MVKQSRAMTILLTRPISQSLRFAADLKPLLPDVPILISPLMVPEYLIPSIPKQDFAALILVSPTAVEAARRISAAGVKLPQFAYCVGDQTATEARTAGFQTKSASGDAMDLLALIKADSPSGALLFLRGRDSSRDLAENLKLAGLVSVSVVSYQQTAQQLTLQAEELLQGTLPVMFPVFSSRSATLLQAELARISPKCPLWIATLSPVIAAQFDPNSVAGLRTAHHPDGASMISAVQALHAAMGSP